MITRNLRHKKIILAVLAVIFIFGAAPTNLRAQENDKELLLIAQKAFEDGFYDVAIRYIEQLLAQFPETPNRVEANLLLGQCYFFKNQYLLAYDVFQKLLNYTEHKDATLYWLGETYLKGADYKQAEKQYKELIENFPNSEYTPQAYYSLGWAYFDQTDFEKAKSTFSKLITKFPLHPLSEDAGFKMGETEFNRQKYKETIEYYQQYLKNYPESSRKAECFFYIAESYYYLNDPRSASSYYIQAVQLSDDAKLTLMAKVSLGWCSLKTEQFELSRQNFTEALAFAQEKNIISDDVYLGQASLYSALEEHNKALEAYTEIINRFPESARISEAYLGKANAQYILKQYKQAVETYEKLIAKFEPNKAKIDLVEKAYFGSAWSRLKLGDIEGCIAKFQHIKNVTRNKTVKISALTQIGDAYQDIEEYEKAVEIYDQIMKEFPDSLFTDYVQYRQGVALLKMNKIGSATLSFQSLKANFPDSKYVSDTKYYLAVAHYKNNDWFNAKKQILEFIKDPGTSQEFITEANYILALSHMNLNEHNDAIKVFGQIIKNYPGQVDLVRKSELNIAKSYYGLGDYTEALKRFKMLVAKYPDETVAQEALILAGNHYLENDDFNSAVTYYQKFAKDFPGSEKINLVYYQMGQAYRAREEYDRAIDAFKRIDDLGNREIYAKAKLAIAEIFARDLEPESAVETFKKIIENSPEFSRDAYVKIGEILKGNKNFEQSIREFQSALKSPKNLSKFSDAEIQFHIADAYQLTGKSKEAVDAYFKIPYLYPSQTAWNVKAYLRIARIFEDNEDWEQAQNIYNKIIELQTDEYKFAQERLEWIKENTVK